MDTQTITPQHCLHCDHRWYPRMPGRPAVCPACHRTRWDKPRKWPQVVHVKRGYYSDTASELDTHSEVSSGKRAK